MTSSQRNSHADGLCCDQELENERVRNVHSASCAKRMRRAANKTSLTRAKGLSRPVLDRRKAHDEQIAVQVLGDEPLGVVTSKARAPAPSPSAAGRRQSLPINAHSGPPGRRRDPGTAQKLTSTPALPIASARRPSFVIGTIAVANATAVLSGFTRMPNAKSTTSLRGTKATRRWALLEATRSWRPENSGK